MTKSKISQIRNPNKKGRINLFMPEELMEDLNSTCELLKTKPNYIFVEIIDNFIDENRK